MKEIKENEYLRPFVKWAGGKEQELSYILPLLPKKITDYYEPFVGGGAVYFALSNKNISGTHLINDKSSELISLYRCIQTQSKAFLNTLDHLNEKWKQIDTIVSDNRTSLLNIYKSVKKNGLENTDFKKIISDKYFDGIMSVHFCYDLEHLKKQLISSYSRKLSRVVKLEKENDNFGDDNVLDNIFTSFKSAFYTHFRYIYNEAKKNPLKYDIQECELSAIFYFIRQFCYASMFRYNGSGDFNVPYGGMGYNKNDFGSKIEYLKSPKLFKYLRETTISENDFENFISGYSLKANDFIFLDPPYDTEFSNYAQNEFGKQDQIRLASFLYNTKAKFMLVIKETPFIKSLYINHGFEIITFDKKYMVNFQNRNDRNVKHLIIMNYKEKGN